MSDTESDSQLESLRDSQAIEYPESEVHETGSGKSNCDQSVTDSESKNHSELTKVNEFDQNFESSKPRITEDSESTVLGPSVTAFSSIKVRRRPIDLSTSETGGGLARKKSRFNQPFNRRDRSQQPATASSLEPEAKKLPSWLKPEDVKFLKSDSSEENPQRNQQQSTKRGRYDSRSSHESGSKSVQEIQEDLARKTQNVDYVVKQHYNKRTLETRNQNRESSPIIKLRHYNNAIKFILINNATRKGDRVLDLGCGKGGDLRKYTMADISYYVGIDISNASISEAMKRYTSSRAMFQVTFITGDCFGRPLHEVLSNARLKQPVRFPFDVVSMQFCMHYAFENEQKARQLLENVTTSLRPGGLFIGTIPSSDFIREKLKRFEPGTKQFGNSIYSVTFQNQPPPDGFFTETFGNTYNYFLRDAIDNVPEYVVPFEAFRGLALEFGLKLRFKKSFTELFMENIPTWRNKLGSNIMRNLERTDGRIGIQGEEAEAGAFYLCFEFVKVE